MYYKLDSKCSVPPISLYTRNCKIPKFRTFVNLEFVELELSQVDNTKDLPDMLLTHLMNKIQLFFSLVILLKDMILKISKMSWDWDVMIMLLPKKHHHLTLKHV